MSPYPHVPLGEICAINPRTKRTGSLTRDTVVSFVPMAAVDERLGTIAVREERTLEDVSKGFTSFEEGDVLFAKITPCMENGKIALARNLTNGIGRGSTEFYVLRPSGRILSEYIYYFVRQPQFRKTAQRNFTGTAGQQRVPKSFMETALVPLPPIDEQCRIVGILNRAVGIELLRARAADRLREFVPALFIKMFGDPIENPMGWKVKRLGELTEEFRYGTSKKCYDNAGNNDVPILRIPNVLNNSVNWHSLRFTSLGIKECEKLRLRHGDLLFVRTNGNPDYIGRCAVFTDRRRAAYASYLIRARLKLDEAIDPEYIAGSLALPAMRQTILGLARTTAGNYNINIKSLGSIKIPIPTLNLQRKFSAIVKEARWMASMTETASQACSTLSGSLMPNLLARKTHERGTV